MPVKTYSPQARIWLQTYNNKYVTSARHDLNFVDRGRYTTTVDVVRGTGFIELQKRRLPQ